MLLLQAETPEVVVRTAVTVTLTPERETMLSEVKRSVAENPVARRSTISGGTTAPEELGSTPPEIEKKSKLPSVLNALTVNESE